MIVGVLGGGQLARMLALAGYPLGLRFVFLDPAVDACAAPLGEHIRAAYDDQAALALLADKTDCVTFEFENVPPEAVEWLSEHASVYPSLQALATARDRQREKTLFGELAIPTAAWSAVDSRKALARAVGDIGLPAVLKTSTLGYDGKGQCVLRRHEDVAAAWDRLGGVPLILEAFVPFERELSIIAARGRVGETAFYPLSENTHRDGILRLSVSRPDDPMQARAEDYARRLLDKLEYVGVLALELFQIGDKLLANEFAPRVHNSGHWTIEGAGTSQFENHLRAVLGFPLGNTAPVGAAAMVNFIGALPDPSRVLAVPQVHLHAYGKPPRPGRKVGHATLHTDDERALHAGLDKLLALAPDETRRTSEQRRRV